MTLREWLFYSRMTQRKFAKRIGISKTRANAIATNEQKCDPFIALKIFELTRGAVPLESLISKKKMERIREKCVHHIDLESLISPIELKALYVKTIRSLRRNTGKKNISHGKVGRPPSEGIMVFENDLFNETASEEPSGEEI